MNQLEVLEKKIRQAAEQLAHLKEERQKLLAELKFLEDENKRSKSIYKERENWHEEKKAYARKIEKIIKRIDGLYTE